MQQGSCATTGLPRAKALAVTNSKNCCHNPSLRGVRSTTWQSISGKAKKSAFSLVEILVALIIVSLITAAMAPTITKKLSSSGITITGGGTGTVSGGAVSCNLGEYIEDNTCKNCSVGFRCDGLNKIPCPEGTYSLVKQSECTTCEAGNYCVDGIKNPCNDGYYSENGAKICLENTASNCEEKFKTQYGCTSCKTGYNLVGISCVSQKPVDYVFTNSSGVDITSSATSLSVDGNNRWKITIIQSGNFVFKELNSLVDVFVLGGGAGGKSYAGGGGGYTKTVLNSVLVTNMTYPVTVGAGGGNSANGGDSSAFGVIARGGKTSPDNHGGGAGGSGAGADYKGAGGTDGGKGADSTGDGNCRGGWGQGHSTREFGESSGTLYASGGHGGNYGTINGAANTGNGGTKNGSGGSGIVVIRGYGIINSNASTCKINSCVNCVENQALQCNVCQTGYSNIDNLCKVNTTTVSSTFPVEYKFEGSGGKEYATSLQVENGKWKLIVRASGTLTFTKLPSNTVDVFAVGGGGGAGTYAGGGGGYTKTKLNAYADINTPYSITIGQGGSAGSSGGSGGTTSGLGVSASGGGGATPNNGGAGGSGGGGDVNGARGSNGSNGGNSNAGVGGQGQGSTTREFGEVTGYLYSTGGGGYHQGAQHGNANTGDGGGPVGGTGGSGVLIIRGTL